MEERFQGVSLLLLTRRESRPSLIARVLSHFPKSRYHRAVARNTADIPQGPLRFALFGTRPHMGWAVVAIVFSSLAQLVETSVAFIFQHVVDNATRFSVGEVAYGAVIFWVAAYPASVLLNQILWRSSGFTGMRWLTGFRMTAQMTLFSYLTSQSHAYFSSRFTGAIVSKIRNAENGIASILESLLWNYLPTLLSFILSAVFAWIASPLL